jgi:hypothetical protein
MLGADGGAQAASAMSATPQTIALAAMNAPCPPTEWLTLPIGSPGPEKRAAQRRAAL